MNDYRIVDLKNWERAVHCAVFRDYIEPCFCGDVRCRYNRFL